MCGGVRCATCAVARKRLCSVKASQKLTFRSGNRILTAEVPHLQRVRSYVLRLQQAHVWWRSLRYVCQCQKASMWCESVSESDFSHYRAYPDCRGTSPPTCMCICVAAAASPCVVSLAALHVLTRKSVSVAQKRLKNTFSDVVTSLESDVARAAPVS